jgi:hypothetical protein
MVLFLHFHTRGQNCNLQWILFAEEWNKKWEMAGFPEEYTGKILQD